MTSELSTTYKYKLLSTKEVKGHYLVLISTYKDGKFVSFEKGWTSNPAILKEMEIC